MFCWTKTNCLAHLTAQFNGALPPLFAHHQRCIFPRLAERTIAASPRFAHHVLRRLPVENLRNAL